MSNGWGITNLSLYVWLWRFQNAASSSFSVNRGAFHRSDPSHMSDPLTLSDARRAFKTSTRIRGRAPSAIRCAFVSRMSTARLSASRRIFAASFPVHSRQRGSSHLQPCMYSGRLGSWSFTGQGFHIDVEPTQPRRECPRTPGGRDTPVGQDSRSHTYRMTPSDPRDKWSASTSTNWLRETDCASNTTTTGHISPSATRSRRPLPAGGMLYPQ